MKKFLSFATLALTVLMFASCEKKPEPEKTIFTFSSEVDGTSATISVSCSEPNSTYFWSVLTEEDYNEYATQEELLAMIREDYEKYAEFYEMLYGITSFEEYVEASVSQGDDEWTYEDLDPETKYIIWAVKVDSELKALSKIETAEFTTGEAPEVNEEEIYYANEPTTPQTLTWNMPEAYAISYGTYWGENTSNFNLVMGDDSKAVYLDLICAANLTELPAGTFTACSAYDEVLPVGSFVGGDMYLYQYQYGGSYGVTSDSKAYWLEGGSLTIAKNGETYNISGTLISHYGSKITVSYTGTIMVEEGTVNQTIPAKLAKKQTQATKVAPKMGVMPKHANLLKK